MSYVFPTLGTDSTRGTDPRSGAYRRYGSSVNDAVDAAIQVLVKSALEKPSSSIGPMRQMAQIDTIEAMQATINSLRNDNELLRDENKTLRDENRALHDDNKTLWDDNKTFQSDIETLQSKSDALYKYNANLYRENRRLLAKTGEKHPASTSSSCEAQNKRRKRS